MGGSQEDTLEHSFRPYAYFRRDGERIAMELRRNCYRPWLDGVREYELDEEALGACSAALEQVRQKRNHPGK